MSSVRSAACKAVILCAGQGSRLLPLTTHTPKSLLRIGNLPIIHHQLRSLSEAGVRKVVVVTGFRDDAMLESLRDWSSTIDLTVVHNPFFGFSENIGSAWLAREHFAAGGLLLNGDTLIEPDMVRKLIADARWPITLCSDFKGSYDDDDMKITIAGNLVSQISKKLAEPDGESVGIYHFTPAGGQVFVEELDRIIRMPHGLSNYYISALEAAAVAGLLSHVSVSGMRWFEIDDHDDLDAAERFWSSHVDQIADHAGIECFSQTPSPDQSALQA